MRIPLRAARRLAVSGRLALACLCFVVAQGGASAATPPEKMLPDWVYTSADIIHLVTPHLKDLDVLTSVWILDDNYPPENPQRKAADKLYADFRWTEALTVTSLYIVALLGLSCWRFATRDY